MTGSTVAVVVRTSVASSIVYVPYAVGTAIGYYDSYYGSYAPGQVYDANGRPLCHAASRASLRLRRRYTAATPRT